MRDIYREGRFGLTYLYRGQGVTHPVKNRILFQTPHLPEISIPAAAAKVGSQSVTCNRPLYSVPHSSCGMWLGEYMNAGTYMGCIKRHVT